MASPVRHRKVTDLLKACISLCLSTDAVRHLGRCHGRFPTKKCNQQCHHCHPFVGQPGLRAWWLGEWLASTWKFSADRINLFLLLLLCWLCLPWFKEFLLKLWERTVPSRSKHSYISDKFQTNLRCCCLSLSFSLQDFANTQVSKECVKERWKKLNCCITCKFSREIFLLYTQMLPLRTIVSATHQHEFIFNSCFISNVAYSHYFSICLSQSFAHSTSQSIQICREKVQFFICWRKRELFKCSFFWQPLWKQRS